MSFSKKSLSQDFEAQGDTKVGKPIHGPAETDSSRPKNQWTFCFTTCFEEDTYYEAHYAVANIAKQKRENEENMMWHTPNISHSTSEYTEEMAKQVCQEKRSCSSRFLREELRSHDIR